MRKQISACNVRCVTSCFPRDVSVKREIAEIPIACFVRPAAREPMTGRYKVVNEGVVESKREKLPRCTRCFAYANSFCVFSFGGRWNCSLCGQENVCEGRRYRSSVSRGACTELKSDCYEIEIGQGIEGRSDATEVLAFLVSVRDDEQLRVIKRALHSVIDNMKSHQRMSLICVGDRALHVYDLSSSVPHVRRMRRCSKDVALNDVLSSKRLLAAMRSKESRRRAHAAVDSLSVLNTHGDDRDAKRFEMWESAVRLWIDHFLRNDEGATFARRMVCFLSTTSNVSSKTCTRQLCARARAAKLCVDGFVLQKNGQATQPRDTCTSVLMTLVRFTGGVLRTHGDFRARGRRKNLDDEIREELTTRTSFGQCMLRVRVSPGFSIDNRCFGDAFVDDDELPGVWQFARCDARTSFGFEFKSSAISSHPSRRCPHATVQIALAYSSIVAVDDRQNKGGDSVSGERLGTEEASQKAFRCVRRIRVRTIRVPLERSPAEVLKGIDADALFAFAVRKILHENDGVCNAEENRIRLKRWCDLFLNRCGTFFDCATQKTDFDFVRIPKLLEDSLSDKRGALGGFLFRKGADATTLSFAEEVSAELRNERP